MKRLFLSLLLIIPLVAFGKVQSGQDLLVEVRKEISNINTKQLKKIIASEKDLVLIDVRTEHEINTLGTIDAGQNVVIPRGWVEFRIDEYADVNTPIVVYCGQDLRSPLVAKRLMDLGYKNVRNYADGYLYWRDNGGAVEFSDNAPQSVLFSLAKKVTDGVYSAIGATTPGNYENSGHNNNLSFIVGDKSVLVFNAGGSYLLAQALDEEIKKITNKPVRFVVLENAQGHAILGSKYWQQQGATIIGQELIIDEINKNKDFLIERGNRVLRDKFYKTEVVLPDTIFKKNMTLDLGNLKVELLYFGPAHSPEDIELWIPSKKLLISGDFAFNKRLLPILPHTDSKNWLKIWHKLTDLKPEIIIPGHGDVTNIKTVTEFTVGYLGYIRKQVENILANGGDLADVYKIDQSMFRTWDTFYELYLQNAARLYQQMEFE